MPRPSLGARLQFIESDGFWYIRDGSRRRSTGCPREDRAGAERALAEYLATKHEPSFGRGHPDEVSIIDVLILYATERGPHTRRPDVIASAVRHLGRFWNGKVVGQITPGLCTEYVKWRTGQAQARFTKSEAPPKVGDQTARRELEVLSAAIGHAYRERKLRFLVPVALPAKKESRERWLSRSEVARLLWAAWRQDQGKSRHLVRFILIALYTGTRHDAVLRLRWTPSTDSGWIDLDRGVIYRKGSGEKQTSKRRTPVPISNRLLPHLRRWRRSSTTHAVEYAGGPVGSIKRSWNSARNDAGLGPEVVPHILRHTFATWAVMDGLPFGKVAAALGTSERMVQQVYGHHAPEHLRDVVNAVGRQAKLRRI
ncbi:tyrosine-type recombinase/integrase [Methylobacterium nodulans]|uniref:Integrase family protein n=1 Tax=Methylobacterium nodulans (strain LMG 21967 / CNCM I-2342 / ORS 2060) TaxID=460265 RepID=B8IRG6_METNO|nr:site-specific integrase [Methylobacterium nodulans]ACL58706.1 integrase family protein [Methylobacterium nodulans ORS 2060]